MLRVPVRSPVLMLEQIIESLQLSNELLLRPLVQEVPLKHFAVAFQDVLLILREPRGAIDLQEVLKGEFRDVVFCLVVLESSAHRRIDCEEHEVQSGAKLVQVAREDERVDDEVLGPLRSAVAKDSQKFCLARLVSCAPGLDGFFLFGRFLLLDGLFDRREEEVRIIEPDDLKAMCRFEVFRECLLSRSWSSDDPYYHI